TSGEALGSTEPLRKPRHPALSSVLCPWIMIEMSAAERLRAHRNRRRAGRVVLHIEVNFFELSDALVSAGLVPQWDAEDKAAVAAGVERALEILQRVSSTDEG